MQSFTENVLGTILVQYVWQKYLIKENKKGPEGGEGAHKYKVVPDYFLDDVLLNMGVKLKLHCTMWLKKGEIRKKEKKMTNKNSFFFLRKRERERNPWNVCIKNGDTSIFFTNTHMKAVYGKICLFKLIKNDFQSDRDIEMNMSRSEHR